MFDLGWSELLIVALVVLMVIGPRELPKAMRMVAKWVRKGRALAREFQSSIDDLARESELDSVKKDLQEFSRYDPGKELADAADPDHELEREFRTNPDMPTIDTTDDPDLDDDLLLMDTAGDAPSHSSATAKPSAPAENTIASNSSPSADGGEPTPEPAEPTPEPAVPAEPTPEPAVPAEPARAAQGRA